jgi:uncharacterized SAM-binding protein YcdF (DUF218 family)
VSEHGVTEARPRQGVGGRLLTRRRAVATPAAAMLLALCLWLLGLLWFAGTLPTEVSEAESATDAIVVLTGGRLRIDEGLALLAQGKAKKLFVSGVHHGVTVAELLHLSPEAPLDLACCIELGYAADNTSGNAQETAAWMRREGFTSLRLVTAGYHMPRSLLELRRALPEARIVPNPVFPERVRQAEWWVSPGTAWLLVGEYNKYLGAMLRGFVLHPQREAEPA